MVLRPYNFQFNPNQKTFCYISWSSQQIALFEWWISTNQTNFTLQLNFLRISVLDPNIDDWNQNVQSVNKKPVHHEAFRRFSDNFLPHCTSFSFFKKESSSTVIHFIYSLFGNLHVQKVLLRNYDPQDQNYSYTRKKLLIDFWPISRTSSFVFDSAQIDPHCISIKVSVSSTLVKNLWPCDKLQCPAHI